MRVARADGVDYSGVHEPIARADTESLREVNLTLPFHFPSQPAPSFVLQIFERYASVRGEDGRAFMTSDDFVRKYLGMYEEEHFNPGSVAIVAGAADTTKDGLISFEEFKVAFPLASARDGDGWGENLQAFEAVLCSPDALYLTAFEMFDTNASDNVSFDEFKRIIRHTAPVSALDFDFDGDFIKLHFGKDKRRDIGYLDFCQLLHDFYEEQGVQAFKKFDTKKSVRFLLLLSIIIIINQTADRCRA